MEVQFTPEQEAQLTEIAAKQGTQADRGDFAEEAEMDARLELLHS